MKERLKKEIPLVCAICLILLFMAVTNSVFLCPIGVMADEITPVEEAESVIPSEDVVLQEGEPLSEEAMLSEEESPSEDIVLPENEPPSEEVVLPEEISSEIIVSSEEELLSENVVLQEKELLAENVLLIEGAPQEMMLTVPSPEPVSIQYRTHIQNIGWERDWRQNGEMSGTSGRALRLEAIELKLSGIAPEEGSVEYRTHIQNIGWESTWKHDGGMSGTSGRALRLEAIQIRLTGNVESRYDIYYRVHVQNIGWLDWAKNGEKAGSAGYAYRLEGIEVKLVEKGAEAPGSTEKPFLADLVQYRSHIQNVGWESTWKHDGGMSGTSGRALRLEGLYVRLNEQPYPGSIEYRTHIQSIGWESTWKKNGEMSGTSGRALRLEAMQIRLTGEMADHYDVYYRVHAQNLGWMGWAKNGEMAGTEWHSYRLEALEIKLVEKGASAPGATENHYLGIKGEPGWYRAFGKTYRFDENGDLMRGWYVLDGLNIFTNPSTAGNRYFFDRVNGEMYTGTCTVDGASITFASDGVADAKLPDIRITAVPDYVINVLDYGATAGDGTDDTAAFRNAIAACGEGGTVYVPSGKYIIRPTTGIRPHSNMNIIMERDAVLEVSATNSANYDVIRLSYLNNVHIFGGQIQGEWKRHTGTSGEGGNGIGIYDSTNVSVSYMTVTNNWGDGIYISTNVDTDQVYGCDGIRIRACNVSDNRRTNISIVDADNVMIDSLTCIRSAKGGTQPECGLNIEPNYIWQNGQPVVAADKVCKHITIKHSTINTPAKGYSNYYFCFQTVYWPYDKNFITTEDLQIYNCSFSGDVGNYSGRNCRISNSTIGGTLYLFQNTNLSNVNAAGIWRG